MANLVQKGPTYEPDSLFVSNQIAVLTKGVTLAKGVVAKRGAIITLDGTTKKGNVADKARTTDIIYGVLTDDVDATVADAIATVYITGHFNAESLSFKAGTTLDDFEMELRKLGIYTGTVKEGN
ncbi:MAG: head decoration protein [Cellulosilyticaceae bacterium]